MSTKNQTSMVEAVYLEGDDYQKTVKPYQRVLIPNYFIHYWLPRLKARAAWLVVALQQACWRNDSDECEISQADLGAEIASERRTIGKLLSKNTYLKWYVPYVETQPGYNHKGTYVRPPNKYHVYVSTLLIKEHLAGLYSYFKNLGLSTTIVETVTKINNGLDELSAISPKDLLDLLETLKSTDYAFDNPTSVIKVIELATGIKIIDLPADLQKDLTKKASRLQTHLTNIGFTNCRQYFRREWVPRLGPSLAWLVMVLRSKCFYNPETDELRDTYTWSKSELAQYTGQSFKNIKNLLTQADAEYFIQVLQQTSRTLKIRVALIEEPLLDEKATDFWERQPLEKWKKSDSALQKSGKKVTQPPPKSGKKVTQPPQKWKKSDSAPPESGKKVTLKSTLRINTLKDSIPKENTVESLWEIIKNTYRSSTTKAGYEATVKLTKGLDFADGKLTVGVFNQHALEWIQNRLQKPLERITENIVGTPVIIEFVNLESKEADI